MNINYRYCTPFHPKERQIQPSLEIVPPTDVEKNRPQDGAKAGAGGTQDNRVHRITKYLHLQCKTATVRQTENTDTSEVNITKITDRRQDYLRQLFNLVKLPTHCDEKHRLQDEQGGSNEQQQTHKQKQEMAH